MANNEALEKAVTKVYEQIASNGSVTDNQLAFILLYEKKISKPKKDTFEQLLGYGNKIVNIINKNLKE